VGSISAGNILAALIDFGPAGTAINAPTGCVTWALADSTTSANLQSWYTGSISASGACTITFTSTGASSSGYIQVWELSNTTTTKDGSAGYSHGFQSAGNVAGPSVTTSSSGDIILIAGNTGSGTSIIANTPFTSDQSANIGGAYQAGGHYIQASSGTQAAAWTIGVGGATSDFATIALQASGGGGGPTIDQLMSPNNIGSQLQVVSQPIVVGY
jgi:hypothetical protein